MQHRGDRLPSSWTAAVTLAGLGREGGLATNSTHKLTQVEVLVLLRRSQLQEVRVSTSTQVGL